MLALMLFSYRLGWLPSSGMRDSGYASSSTFDTFVSLDFLHHLILPMLVAGVEFAVLPLLLARSSMLEVLDEDYVQLAQAKGFSPRRVLYRHALRHAMLPVVTEAAVLIGLAFGGLTVIEVVFSWPGLGREIALAVTRQDFPIAQAAFLLLAVMVSLANVVADLAYRALDPRISYRASRA
jgi:peptide/nickel transport system permease protein